MKTPVVVRDSYTMYLEYAYGLLWFHTDVRKWSSSIKVKFVEDLNLLQYLVGTPLVALVEEENTKLAKFGKVTDWKYLEHIKLDNGKQGIIFMRSK